MDKFILNTTNILLLKLKNMKFYEYTKKNIENIINFIYNNFLLNQHNLLKLLTDLYTVYNNNSIYIWYIIRMYLYLTIILYAVFFIIITFSLYSQNVYLLFISKKILMVYYYWTYPIKKFKFLIKYIFIAPYKIISFLLYIINSIFLFFSQIINNISKGGGSAEACPNDYNYSEESKSPTNGRKSSLDSTQWELNCMENYKRKTIAAASIWQNLSKSASLASSAMDNNDEIPNIFSHNWKNSIEKFKDIDNTSWCPNNYEREKWNSEYK